MIRCRHCGARLHEAEPVCVEHGPSVVPAGPSLLRPDPPLVGEGASALLEACGVSAHGVLGRGGFGVVLEGVYHARQRPAVVKISRARGDAAMARMLREARWLRRVAGHQVPELWWHGSVQGWPVLVLERVAGESWARLMARQAGRPLQLVQALPLIAGLLDALQWVHHCGVVHLDLKPENILTTADKRVCIIDFGQARALPGFEGEVDAVPAESTEFEVHSGTAEYMSPERCAGHLPMSPAADLYAVGVLLYELINGAPPFWGPAATVREAHCSERPSPLSAHRGVAPLVDVLLRRCLAKEPRRRFESAAALRQALRQLGDLNMPPATAHQAHMPADAGAAKSPRSVAPAALNRQRLNVGVVLFESRNNLHALREAFAPGEVAQVQGDAFGVVFAQTAADSPAQLALSAAHRLVAAGLVKGALVDVATVLAQQRPDGTHRYLATALLQTAYESLAPLCGVVCTAAAVRAMTDLFFEPIAGDTPRYRLVTAPGSKAEASHMHERAIRLVGRRELLRQLEAGASAALTRSLPTLFTLTGKPGYGRSHLAAVLEQRLRQWFPLATVLHVKAQPDPLGQRGQVLPQLLRRLLSLPASATAEQARALLLNHLGEVEGQSVWAGAALALGYLGPGHAAVDKLAAAPGALRWAAARAAGEVLRLKARQSPYVVLVDDAHLAEDAALDALEYAALAEGAAPIFGCLFVAEGFRERRIGFGTRAGHSEHVQLAALSRREGEQLARALLRPVEHVPPDVIANLLDRTRCVPRLLVELIRGLRREGIVRRNDGGEGYFIATDALDGLPDLPIVEWNARREIEALAPGLSRLASLLSVLGADFSLAELEAFVFELDGRDLLTDMSLDPAVGVERLIAEELLQRSSTGGRYDFRHPLLRDTVYGLMPEAQLPPLHAAAYEVYAQALDIGNVPRLQRLAMHAANSGQIEQAVDAYLQLAQIQVEAQAYLSAEVAFGKALDNLLHAQDPRRVRALRGRGLMRFRLGRNEDAVRDLQAARGLAQSSDNTTLVADLMLDEATVLDWRYKIAESGELVQRAAGLLPSPSGVLRARLLASQARVQHRAGNGAECVRIGLQAADLAAELGDVGYETRMIALLMVAPDCCRLGRLDQAEKYFDTILREAGSHTDLLHLGAAHVNRALLWFGLRRLDHLVADLSRAIGIAREIGEPVVEYSACRNLAEVLYWSTGLSSRAGLSQQTASLEVDGLRHAAEHAKRSAALAGQMWGVSVETSICELLLARIYLYAGLRQEAGQLVASIRQQWDRVQGGEGDPRWTAVEDVLLRAVELACSGASDEAWGAAEARWMSGLLEPQDRLEWHETRALAALRSGYGATARTEYARAVELAQSHENLMSDRVASNAACLLAPSQQTGPAA